VVTWDESEQSCRVLIAFPPGHESSHLRTGDLTVAPGGNPPTHSQLLHTCFASAGSILEPTPTFLLCAGCVHVEAPALAAMPELAAE
jgi:hypothetical protein